MNLFFWVIPAYLLGSFPTGVVLSRKKYGIDVREMGSGNIGATNITRVFGWYAGILVFLIDFLKAFIPMWVIQERYPENPWLLTAVGAAVVLGHCFSILLHFRGGKGVATSLACVLVVAPSVAAAAAAVYGILLAKTKISAVGSLGGLLVVLISLIVAPRPWPITCLLLGICFIVILRHRTNIQRLAADWRQR